MDFIKTNGKGLILCLAIAVPAWFLGQTLPVIGGPVFAILIGMTVTLFPGNREAFSAGINYTSKKILQAAVVFLGFGMNLTEILAREAVSSHHPLNDHNFPGHRLSSV